MYGRANQGRNHRFKRLSAGADQATLDRHFHLHGDRPGGGRAHLHATPIYEASSRIVIEKENPNLVSIQEVMAVDSTGTDYYQTQYKIIESRVVAREVIRKLDLANSAEFLPPPEDTVVAQVNGWVKGAHDRDNGLVWLPDENRTGHP